MIPVSSLQFLEDHQDGGDALDDRAAPEPKVFVRVLTCPAGWPWEQARSVDLDARHGAPMPIGDLRYQLRRLEPWRPGAAARFAAFYVLASDVGEQLEARADVEGRTLAVTFAAARVRNSRAALAVVLGLVLVALVILLGVAGANSLTRRAETEAVLAAAEQRASAKLRAASTAKLAADAQRLLARQPERGAPLADVIADLTWAAAERSPDVSIEGVHWRDGVVALEVRGDAPPFVQSDREVARFDEPVRRGVWLWTAKRRAAADR